MSIFGCNDPPSPESSEPTIPVILRGKKKANNKSMQLQPSRVVQPPRIMNPNPPASPLKMPKVPIIIQQTYSPYKYATHLRSISAPRFQQVFHRVPTVAQRVPTTINTKPVSTQGYNLTTQNQSVSNDVRKRLDANLKRVYDQLNQKKMSYDFGSNRATHSLEFNRNQLQKKLVEQYIQLIYRDYAIQDPLASRSQVNNFYRIQGSTATEPNRRNTDSRRKGQSVMSGSTNKKAVQLKQSFLIEMFSPADQHASQSASHSRSAVGHQHNLNVPGQFLRSAQNHLSEISQVTEREVKQIYRYCFICEQPILQANIDLHEREKCPEFCHLYEMNLTELRDALIRKVHRLRKQGQEMYEELYQAENENRIKQKIKSLKQETKRYLGCIDNNIKVSAQESQRVKDPQIWNGQIKSNFSAVMKCYEQNYCKMYQNLRKLQWFVLMLKNLQTKYPSAQRNKSVYAPSQIRKTSRETQIYESRRLSLSK